jgi:hypothetical protein
VEIFDGAVMEALGLDLRSKGRGGDVGSPGEANELEGEPVGCDAVGGGCHRSSCSMAGGVLGWPVLEAIGDKGSIFLDSCD